MTPQDQTLTTTGQSKARIRWGKVLPIERVVTVLTPLLFAPVAALIAGAVAKTGLTHVDPTAIIAIEGAAFVSAVGIAARWLHGRQILPANVVNAIGGVATPLIDEANKLGLTPAIEAFVKSEIDAALTALHLPQEQVIIDKVIEGLTGRLTLAAHPPPPAAPATTAAAPAQA